MTSQDSFLSSVFETEESIQKQTKKFLKRLGYCMSMCFRKIRVNHSKKNKVLEDLFNQRRILKHKIDDNSFEKLKDVEAKLATICASDNVRIITEACAGLTCEGGGVNAGKIWKLKKQLRGIVQDPPTAMLDASGNLVTTNRALEKLVLEQYKERLCPHPIKDSLRLHQVQREELCKEKIEEAYKQKTPDWVIDDIDLVLKQLKNNKSRDPLGFGNEMFKPENAGTDLRKALLNMCNQIDKLIYNDEYESIDKNLTDSNVGARRNRNIRDNIFVMNAILLNVRRRKLKGTDVQIFDAEKCFDKLWAKE